MGPIQGRTSGLAAVLLAGLLGAPPVAAQATDGAGLVATGLLLRQMDGVKRVLMIGAHPDDEDSSLLAALSREWGVETAYLSLTRGDGGQNLIGPELFEGLGVIRTGELEAAREIDGGVQFFTRAFDYGFSKSAEEALTFWPREELLADVVWVVRKFRPQVIVSVWSGTPADGHGQHQAAGILAREAFAVAGDPSRFPEQIDRGVEAWVPMKLYQTARRGFGGRAQAAAGQVAVETGGFDPLLGRSAYQVSMYSRSQHRSQDMGAAQPPGPRETGVILVESRVAAGDGGIFAGVDTTLVGLAGSLVPEAAAATRGHLEAYRSAVSRARDGLGLDPGEVAPVLAEALAHLDMARLAAGDDAPAELRRALERKTRLATRAYLSASGVVVDVRAADDLVVPGQDVEVQLQLWNGGDRAVGGIEAMLAAPHEWSVRELRREGVSTMGELAPGALATWTYEVTVPDDAEPSRLYFLQSPRDGAMYRWPAAPDLWGLPRDPAPVSGRVALEVTAAGERVLLETERSWRFVGVDPADGEFREPVLIVPALSVRPTPGGTVWPAGRAQARTVSVAVRSESSEALTGYVSLEAPQGWRVTPTAHPFDLDGEGAERTVTFQIAPSGAPEAGERTFRAVARTDRGVVYDESVALIDYDHIERAAMFEPARVEVSVVPVRVAEGLRVGYVMGSGDDGPEAIRQMGAEVELLNEEQVREGAYVGYDAVVLGVRAFETRPDLQSGAAQLLDFARAGGTVVAQYNRGAFDGLAPYDLRVGRNSPRVSDETAAVRVLRPEAPVFTTPNRITQADFDGWVQERGLYFGAEWDPRYTPLLELHDPGEDPRLGSLLVARVGDGVFVYAALSFFRQWSEQVPGAYRLFANLISLDASSWSDFAGTGRERP